MFKVNKKRHQNDVNDVVVLSLMLTLTIFHTFFSVYVIDHEQENVSWVIKQFYPYSQTQHL